MGMLDMQTYMQLQAADAMRDAAQNPSGGAGLTAGIGAGMGVGQILAGSLAGFQGQTPSQQPAQGQAPQTTPPAAGGMPELLTPENVAQYLNVSEEDVMAAINAGDLKARKIGSAYRITKEALEAFLKDF